ncbi:hypothetical protein V3C99_013167 [Haemonchus contortus]
MKSLIIIFYYLFLLNVLLYCSEATDYNYCPGGLGEKSIPEGFCFEIHIYPDNGNPSWCKLQGNETVEATTENRISEQQEAFCEVFAWNKTSRKGSLHQQLRCFCGRDAIDDCEREIKEKGLEDFDYNDCREFDLKDIRVLLSSKSVTATEKEAETQVSTISTTTTTTIATPITTTTPWTTTVPTTTTTSSTTTSTTTTTTTTRTTAATTTTPTTTTTAATTTTPTTTTTAATTTTPTTTTTTTPPPPTTTTTKTTTSTTTTTTNTTTSAKAPVSTFLTTTFTTTVKTPMTATTASTSMASTISTKKSSKSPSFTEAGKPITTLPEKSTGSVFIPTTVLTESAQVTETTTTTEEPFETTTTEYYDPGRITTIWITREREYRRKLKELE